MDSQHLLEIGPFDTWAALPEDWDPGTAVSPPIQRGSDFGHAENLPSRTRSLLDEDYDLFDCEEMDRWFFDVPESNNPVVDYASSASFCPVLEAEGTSPGAPEKRTRTGSDGRPPLTEVVIDMPGERRRAQNRAAQRAHRERQKRYVAQLEKRFFTLQANYNQLDEKYRKVEREHQSLIRMLSSRQTPTTSPASQASADSFLSICNRDSIVASEFVLCEQEPGQASALSIDRTLSTNLGVP